MSKKHDLDKRALKHADALGAEPVYLSCFKDVGQGDVEAFIGIVHPAYVDNLRKLANKIARKAHRSVVAKTPSNRKGKK